MPQQTEPSANNAAGGLLQAMLPRSIVRSENTQAIANQPGLRPDILLTANDRAPDVLEAEARSRLRLEVSTRLCALPSVHGGKARPRGAALEA